MKRRRVHELHSVEVQLVVQLDDASESRLSHEGSILLALGDDRDGTDVLQPGIDKEANSSIFDLEGCIANLRTLRKWPFRLAPTARGT